MKNKETLCGKLTGKNRENIPNTAFKIMAFLMKMTDIIGNQSTKHFKTLALQPGQTVIDYGCGPARYIKNASKCVGEAGKVIAVDIHPLAIKFVNEKKEKYNLKNVEAVLAEGYTTAIPSETADVVYALDMFHMIEQPGQLINELHRLVKPNGTIIIEDGHQPRSETKHKIENTGLLTIIEGNRYHLKCRKN